ncbi:hypothetical protein [Legionella sp. km772]|uniref:hypothetical protein n=1 Tax=Legionella sp. km772 TaxID=2498111 RepID=UPI000F8DF959|nr:hypothetical protein [Legionella sp. km772]RUR09330.1 hypothetical protein ELY15_09400 [Legionella sp. km772]
MLFNIHNMLVSQHGQQKLRETLKYNFIELHNAIIEDMMDRIKHVFSLVRSIDNLSQEELDDYEDFSIPCNALKKCIDSTY